MSLSSTSSCRFFNTIFLWLWWCMAFYSNLFGNPQKNTKNKLPFSFSCDSPFHFQSKKHFPVTLNSSSLIMSEKLSSFGSCPYIFDYLQYVSKTFLYSYCTYEKFCDNNYFKVLFYRQSTVQGTAHILHTRATLQPATLSRLCTYNMGSAVTVRFRTIR
jgi:hypothetical protein